MNALADAAARDAIRGDLDQSWVVEAAAGTGKTSELVQRIVRVILTGRGRLASIASVTFTEKAAGEMKLRIRTELDRALFDPALPAGARTAVRDALSELETAKVGTIHAFCAELLREHPVEAGIDPSFEVADGARQRALLERVFSRWFERALADPPEGVRRVVQRRGVDPHGASPATQLLAAAARLVETRDFDTPYRRDPLDRAQLLDAQRIELHALAALATHGRVGDPLAKSLAALATRLEQAAELDCDGYEEFLRRLVRDRDVWNDRSGRGDLYTPELARSDVLATRERVRQQLEVAMRACDADLAACLSRELAAVVRAYEEAKTEAGLLDFFDLLLTTRDLLRGCERTRRNVQDAFSHVFVDEFQDTDPVQSEILLLMCATDGGQSDPWRVRLAPGKLFVVGDPKQSIYRFRRADVSLYERVKQQLLASGARVLQLSTSFRSLPGIQACVNAAFEPVMQGDAAIGQAAYVPLAAFRAERVAQPSVIALPAPKPYGKTRRVTKTAINASLPQAVAAWLDWLIRDSDYRVREHGADVPVAARHVCLLFRRLRTNYAGDLTRDYVRALEARRLPHVLSGGRSFHAREEVIAIRSALTAIEWPDDALHVYATLRGPFVALYDETLFSFKAHVGHLHPFGPVDASGLPPEEREVHDVLQLLARLHQARNRRPIADTLAELLHALRAHAGIAIWPTGEQALGNVLRVLDFARAYERNPEASSFRGFVEWLQQQAASESAPDGAVIEESSDGIRLMTVHAAKGLEFPIVVLCDPTAPKRTEHATRFIDPERKLWAQSLCDAEPVELFERRDEVRDHDASEMVRLAYVAATRAQDLLVVPVCGDSPIEGWLDVLVPALYPPVERRRTPETPTLRVPEFGDDSVADRGDHIPDSSVAPGEHRPELGEHRVVWWDPNVLELEQPSAGGLAQHDLLKTDDVSHRDEAGLAAYNTWRERRNQTLSRGAQPSLQVRAMTQAAAQSELAIAAPVVLDLQSTRAGRPQGPRFGTLVHALLANLSFEESPATDEVERLARMIARAIGATEDESTRAAADVRTALAHPFFERVRRAARSGELDREAPVTLKTAEGELLDGIVDLVFCEHVPAGPRLILIDFKTDVELRNLAPYARQLALYAQALERARGLPVEGMLVRV